MLQIMHHTDVDTKKSKPLRTQYYRMCIFKYVFPLRTMSYLYAKPFVSNKCSNVCFEKFVFHSAGHWALVLPFYDQALKLKFHHLLITLQRKVH